MQIINKPQSIKKTFSRLNVLSLVMGSIIGWGSFSLPGTKFLTQSGIINATLGFLIGIISVILIQSGYHIMIERHHNNGGEFSYIFQNLGPRHGFIVGWSLVLCYLSMLPLNATAVVLVLEQIFKDNISYVYLYSVAGYPVYLSEIIIASVVILLFSAINSRGIKVSAFIQDIMVLLLIINVLVILVLMFIYGDFNQFKATYIIGEKISLLKMAPILAIVPFLFVGFDVVPQVSTDLGFPARKATHLTILAIVLGGLIYAALNVITGLAFTPEVAFTKTWATGEAVLTYIGVAGFMLLVIALSSAVAGGINGFMISSSRIVAALADYGLLPARYQQINRYNVPGNSIRFVTVVALIGPWLGRVVILYIVDMASVLAAIVYTYVCWVGVKYAPNMFKRILTALGVGVGIIFILLLLVPGSPSFLSYESLALLGVWILLGIIYYVNYERKSN